MGGQCQINAITADLYKWLSRLFLRRKYEPINSGQFVVQRKRIRLLHLRGAATLKRPRSHRLYLRRFRPQQLFPSKFLRHLRNILAFATRDGVKDMAAAALPAPYPGRMLASSTEVIDASFLNKALARMVAEGTLTVMLSSE